MKVEVRTLRLLLPWSQTWPQHEVRRERWQALAPALRTGIVDGESANKDRGLGRINRHGPIQALHEPYANLYLGDYFADSICVGGGCPVRHCSRVHVPNSCQIFDVFRIAPVPKCGQVAIRASLARILRGRLTCGGIRVPF